MNDKSIAPVFFSAFPNRDKKKTLASTKNDNRIFAQTSGAIKRTERKSFFIVVPIILNSFFSRKGWMKNNSTLVVRKSKNFVFSLVFPHFLQSPIDNPIFRKDHELFIDFMRTLSTLFLRRKDNSIDMSDLIFQTTWKRKCSITKIINHSVYSFSHLFERKRAEPNYQHHYYWVDWRGKVTRKQNEQENKKKPSKSRTKWHKTDSSKKEKTVAQ